VKQNFMIAESRTEYQQRVTDTCHTDRGAHTDTHTDMDISHNGKSNEMPQATVHTTTH